MSAQDDLLALVQSQAKFWSDKLFTLVNSTTGVPPGTGGGGAPPVTDQLAPPAPLGITGSGVPGTVTFSCDPTGDMHDGVTTPSGLPTGSAAYILNVDGVDQTGVNAPSANIQTLPTLWNIGAISPAPTKALSGTQWTLTSQGVGIDSTSDSIGLLGWEITGDFDLYMKLSLFTGSGANIYAPSGLMWREAAAATVVATPGARFGTMTGWMSANNYGGEVKDRLTASTVYTQRATFNGNANARWFKVRRRSNVITYLYSLDGGAWTTAYTSGSISGLSSTLVVGQWASDTQSPASLVTSVSDGLELLAGAQAAITKTYSTSTVVTGKWKAKDVNGNTSAYGPTAQASGVAAGATIRWHPGHYLGSNDYCFLGDTTNRGNRQSLWNVVAGSSLWKGGKIIIPWGSVEQVQGVYDFSEVDIDVAYLKARGRKIIFEPWWMKFGAGTTDTRYFPQYLIDGGYIITLPSGETSADITQAYVAGRLIALAQAFATRYNTETAVEQYIITETAGVVCTQLGTIIDQIGAMWTQCSTACYGNFFDTLTPSAFAARCAAVKMGIGAPDLRDRTYFNGEDFGSRALQGSAGVGTTAGVSNYTYRIGDGGSLTVGTTDRRGVIPVSYSYEALNGVTVAHVGPYAINTLQVTHMCWHAAWGGAAGTNYDDGILPYVTSIGGAIGSSACPSSYGGTCDAS